jgi:3-methyladenine DNA glycosylase AlkD
MFLGVRVPELRRLARQYVPMSLAALSRMLHSRFHEERLLALLVMIRQWQSAAPPECGRLVGLYLSHTRFINNWDLVDLSAGPIVGAYLWDRDRSALDALARSPSLWERRIAIVATHHFIRRGQFADTLRIAERLLADREDLIHKATGWMLREVAKRDARVVEAFLRRHGPVMSRTMLRYAIERFPETRRRAFMAGGGRARRQPSSRH